MEQILLETMVKHVEIKEVIGVSIFADNTKLGNVVNIPQRRDAIERDLHRLERWASANLLKFNKAKCNILHVGQGSPKLKYDLGREWIERSPVVMDLGYWWSQAAAHYKGTKHAKKLKALEAMKNKQKSVTTKDSAKTTFTSITTNTINTSSDKTG
ncbi:rna-directed dna polymerase from mobile element jockey-like [Willisornis vidua]|uniref:Rna-directed dna polymerase from mobile element jockey-like n=1 Tax=Willisornis vidua TaxID=1566151 RepID=A0ABQ9D1M0_9PASS|nr:rna-directed dna polymerase from mobile element jockey-like [Willisornis vidua]